MTDDWGYWKRERSTPGQSRDITEPGCGFWRQNAAKTKIDHPIAIWFDGDIPSIKIGHSLRSGSNELLQFLSEGTWLKSTAVSHAEYLAALETGVWPDGRPARGVVSRVDYREMVEALLSKNDSDLLSYLYKRAETAAKSKHPMIGVYTPEDRSK